MELWDGLSDSRTANTQRAPDREDWGKIIQVVNNIQDHFNGYDETTAQSYGTVASVTGLTVTEYGNASLHKTVLTLDEVELDTTDGTTPATDGAWGTLQLYTFPTGVKLVGRSSFLLDVEADNPGADGLTATADFEIGVGSVASAQATAFGLSGTQSDYGEATAALVASADTDLTATNVIEKILSSTGLHLNLRCSADGDHGTSAGLLKVSGTITVYWTVDAALKAGTTTDLASEQSDIDTNTADIATNVADIATNTADIATNTADIATNVADIATNTADIATNTADIATLEGTVGTEEVVSGMVVTETGTDACRKTVFTLTNVELTTTDGTTPATDGAWGALKLYTFPTGTKALHFADFELDFTENNPGAAGFEADADFNIGLGTAAAAQATAFDLAGAEKGYADVAVALVAGSSTGDTDTNITQAASASPNLYLNLRTSADADHGTAAGALQISGTITFIWTMLR